MNFNPVDVSGWLETARITKVVFTPTDFLIEVSGVDRWPDVTPPGWSGPVLFTLWTVVDDNAIGCIGFWRGRPNVGGPYANAKKDWYYFTDVRQPNIGDTVRFFVTAGYQRRADVHQVAERSNIVSVVYQDSRTYIFDTPPVPVPAPIPVDQLDRIEGKIDFLVDFVKRQG